MRLLLVLALLATPLHAIGFANGVKIGEVTHKFLISATPVVGPDRKNKMDHHANRGFAHEGQRLRTFLAGIPGCVVINGDRHWQYRSVDSNTGLQEFGCGPASDQHAGGGSQENKRESHRFLRLRGGFPSVLVNPLVYIIIALIPGRYKSASLLYLSNRA